MRKIGIRNNTLKLDLLDALATAPKLGYDGVELVVQQSAEIAQWLAPDGAREILDACERNNCAVAALSCGTYREHHFALPDPAERRLGEQFVADCLRASRRLGAGAVLIPYFDWKNLDITPEQEQWHIESLRRCRPVVEETGVKLAIETSFTTAQLNRIIDAVGSPLIGSYHDFANTLRLPDGPVASLRTLGSRVARIHLKDGSSTYENVPLGAGVVDWPACRAAVDEVGYDDWFVLETPAGDDPIESARRNLAFVRAWLA